MACEAACWLQATRHAIFMMAPRHAGAGDRLGLIDEETGESVPTAVLPYCGRTLLEGLLRDLQVLSGLQHLNSASSNLNALCDKPILKCVY